jgi:hypothetical protein
MSQKFTKIPSPLHFFLNRSNTEKYPFLPFMIIHKNWKKKNGNVNERPTVEHTRNEEQNGTQKMFGNNMQMQTVLYVKGNGFKWVLKKFYVTVWTEFMWFGTGKTSNIFHSFLDICFSKAVPCTASWLSHFSLHIWIIFDTWTKAVAFLKDSAVMLYLSLILE